MPGENDLMQAVKKTCGDSIAAAAADSKVPAPFWAALTANESGLNILRGDPIQNIKRREPAVFTHLALVAAGFKSNYGSITASSIDHAEDKSLARPASCHAPFASQAPVLLSPQSPAASPRSVTVDDLLRWSTSWGWTQLMGYHALEWGVGVADLWDPAKHYGLAARLMAGFVKQYSLDPERAFEPMARCWNTGRPDGVTFDLQYVPNLLHRIDVWNSL
jgi:hypothetical protein